MVGKKFGLDILRIIVADISTSKIIFCGFGAWETVYEKSTVDHVDFTEKLDKRRC